MSSISRPKPVLTAAAITSLVTSLAGVLAFLGYAAPAAQLSGEAETIGSVAIAAVTFLTHGLGAYFAMFHTTPVADPKSASGETLVPVSEVHDKVAAAVAASGAVVTAGKQDPVAADSLTGDATTDAAIAAVISADTPDPATAPPAA